MDFVDLSKAFDTVNRDLLWAVSLRVPCPQRFVNILRSFHKGMMAQVTTVGQESRPGKYTQVSGRAVYLHLYSSPSSS